MTATPSDTRPTLTLCLCCSHSGQGAGHGRHLESLSWCIMFMLQMGRRKPPEGTEPPFLPHPPLPNDLRAASPVLCVCRFLPSNLGVGTWEAWGAVGGRRGWSGASAPPPGQADPATSALPGEAPGRIWRSVTWLEVTASQGACCRMRVSAAPRHAIVSS